MELRPLDELKLAAQTEAVAGLCHVQLESAICKTTRDGKPFAELLLLDATDRMILRVWNDHPDYTRLCSLEGGTFYEIRGEFYRNGGFGIDLRKYALRPLEDEERVALLGGPAGLREKQAADLQQIAALAESLRDPRLRAVCELFLADLGERFSRTAGARFVHHARRGGLVEHTAQMMRTASSVAAIYGWLNRDLLVAGTLLHDAGKLWETNIPENSFAISHDQRGELLGHITIGIELVNTLWRKMQPQFEDWRELIPPTEQVRLHLLHLIAAHHGSQEFGSPVVPKTPEAVALHHIDNLDARLEIFQQGYQTLPEIAPSIREKVRPMNHYLVEPLPVWLPPEPEVDAEQEPSMENGEDARAVADHGEAAAIAPASE